MSRDFPDLGQDDLGQDDLGRPTSNQEPGKDPEKLGLTTWKQIVVAALTGGAVGWFLLATVQVSGRAIPLTPWSLTIVLAAITLAVFFYVPFLKAKLRSDRTSVDHQEAVIALVLGKMMVLMGALIGGAHLSYALTNLTNLTAPLPQQRLIRGLICVGVSVLFSIAGSRLEHACIAPGDDDDDDSSGPKGGISVNPA